MQGTNTHLYTVLLLLNDAFGVGGGALCLYWVRMRMSCPIWVDVEISKVKVVFI